MEEGREGGGASDALSRLVAVEARLGALEKRIDALEARPDLEARLSALEATRGGIEGGIEERLRALESSAAATAAPGASSASPKTGPDDLRRIKGIGPKYERALIALGITTYAQIAAWSEEDVARVAVELGTKPERITRAGWAKSAQALAKSG